MQLVGEQKESHNQKNTLDDNLLRTFVKLKHEPNFDT